MKKVLTIIALLASTMNALWAAEAYVVKSTDGTKLTFYYDDNKATREGTVYVMSSNWRSSSISSSITTVIFDSSFAQTRPKSTNNWFSGCSNLQNIEGLQYLNTSEVKDMGAMFAYCKKLKSLNLISFDTSSLIKIKEDDAYHYDGGYHTRGYGMFEGCESLTSLELGNFNTENVKDFSFTFYNCINLKNIDVSSFNTDNATKMVGMFANCSSLTQLDVSNFNTNSVRNYGIYNLDPDLMEYGAYNLFECGMFEGCKKLEILNLSNFDLSNAYEIINMLSDCTNLTQLYISPSFNDIEEKTQSYLSDCTWLKRNHSFLKVGSEYNPCYLGIPDDLVLNVDMSGDYFTWMEGYFTQTERTEIANEPYVIKSTDGTSLTFKYDTQLFDDDVEGTIYRINDVTWNDDNSIQTVLFDSSFTQARPTTTKSWFKGLSSLLSIEGIQYLNTSEVTDMSYMFYRCKMLSMVDLTHFDTRNVTNMSNMFSYSGLRSINLNSFDTKNVTDMSCMFKYCTQIDDYGNGYGLRSIDLSNFDTRNVTNMREMFRYCEYLPSLDLSSFDTRNVTDMSNMFSSCYSLRNLDLSNFDTRNVTNMSQMFMESYELQSLDLSNFDTRNVTDMSKMFFGCSQFDEYSPSGLKMLDVSNFDTRNVTNMRQMFCACSDLISLDVSNFDTHNVTDMSYMFNGCSGLTSLDVSNFDMSKLSSSYNMFYNCSGLTSLNIPTSIANISSSSCSGVGTTESPCLINQPEGFDFGVDTSGDYFVWKGGYFTLGKEEYEGMMGDVNNDGVVSISDAVCIISWLQENTLPVFIEGAADYNKDGSITVSDAIAIIQALLNEEVSPVIPDIPDDDVSHLYPTASAKGIDVELLNAPQYTAFTMDVTLPSNMSIEDITLDERRAPHHQLASKRLANGKYRVIAYSPTLEGFNGNDGTLLTIKTNGKSTGKVNIDNIHFVDMNAQEHALHNANGNVTGINQAEAGTNVYAEGKTIVVDADQDTQLKVYTATGLLYKTLDVKAGHNRFGDNATGIYIVNGKKINIR